MQKEKQKRHLPIAMALILIVSTPSCRQDAPVAERALLKPTDLAMHAPVQFDLDEIQRRGKLVALTLNSSSTYFVYRGHAMGYEYELLSRYAKSIGVSLEIKIIPDVNAMFDLLNKGIGDVIACNLAITKDRLEQARFSRPYNFTRQVLVQRLPDDWESMPTRTLNANIVTSPIELIGKKIYVNRSSNFFSRLHSLENEIGGDINIIRVPGYIDTEKLIQRVAAGEIDYTVSDDNIAQLNATYYPNIDVSVQLSFPQQVGWAVRQNSPALLASINDWFEKNQGTSSHAYIYNKYFKASKDQWEKFNGEYSSLQGNRISDYDELLKEYSKIIDWDWRLLAAQMYQESKFKEDARSWAGAFGLMQLMPATAAAYGVLPESPPEEHIRAAILYLSWLDDYWKERIFDEYERTHFILASYNAGLGHVKDAMNLALSLGYDPQKWENNVAECMLLKALPEYYNAEIVKHGYCRGREPYNYVKSILSQYEHYRKVIS
jgi:membrane-bound lytic murein transglycosylase F